jgi:hypothetical protein
MYASQSIVFVYQSAYKVGQLLPPKPRQVEGKVQGGQTPEQEPETVLGQDEGEP